MLSWAASQDDQFKAENLAETNRLHGFLTPWRIKWYSRSLLFAISIAFIIAVFGGKDASTLTGRLGGDYPAFYGAGRIIAEGDWENLYSPTRQLEIQKDLFPHEKNGFLAFSYPPFVALAYYPLSLFGYRISYIIHSLLMVSALVLTIQLIRPFNSLIDQYKLSALALSLSFYPLFRAIWGGQNTAVILLLIVGTWRMALAHREWLAGIILGLLLFKPQFAIPLIGLFILSGRWRVGLGSALTAVVLYSISSWISGPLWLASWYKFTWWFSQTDAGVNSANSVSWLGFLEAIGGSKNYVALIIGWIMVLLTIIGSGLIWTVGGRRADLTAQLGITMPALVLMPPHVMYYDISLILFTYVTMVAVNPEKFGLIIGFIWLFGFSQVAGTILGFSPLFFLLPYTSILAVRYLSRLAINPDPSSSFFNLFPLKLEFKQSSWFKRL